MRKRVWVVVLVWLMVAAFGSWSVATAVVNTTGETPPPDPKANNAYIIGDYFVGVVQLSEEAAKALEWQVGDLQGWIEGVVYEKASDSMDEMIVRILDDQEDLYLTKAQKQQFSAACADAGVYLVTLDTIPAELKAELVKLANVQ